MNIKNISLALAVVFAASVAAQAQGIVSPKSAEQLIKGLEHAQQSNSERKIQVLNKHGKIVYMTQEELDKAVAKSKKEQEQKQSFLRVGPSAAKLGAVAGAAGLGAGTVAAGAAIAQTAAAIKAPVVPADNTRTKPIIPGKEMKMVELGDLLGKKLAQSQKESEAKEEAKKQEENAAAKAAGVNPNKKALFDSLIERRFYKDLADVIRNPKFQMTDEEGLYVLNQMVKKNGKGLVSLNTKSIAEVLKKRFDKDTQTHKAAEKVLKSILNSGMAL